MKKQVIIVGGSYAGIRALENLYKRDDLEITIIDQNPFHYLQPEVYGFVASTFQIKDIIIDLFTLTASFGSNVHFIQKEVRDIDFDKQIVYTNDLELNYDYVIVATGARTWFPENVKNLGDIYTGGIKSVANALVFKQYFENNIHKMIEHEGLCKINEQFNVVVGGAGLSGVETAAEMAWYARGLFSNFGYLCKSVNIYLVASGSQILDHADQYLVDVSTARLKELGVNTIYNTKITEVMPRSVTLSSGEVLPMDFLIWTGGIIGSPLARTLNVPKTSKHFIKVDKLFKIEGETKAFAIGDAAVLTCPKTGKPMPPTSQMAERTAEYVARTIKLELDGKEPKVEGLKMQGMFVALGGPYGAGVMMDAIKVKGYIAHLIKQAIFKFYKIPLLKKCKKGYELIRESL